MRAAMVTGFGSPDVLVTTDVPQPVAAPGGVVVDVAAAGVLWVDAMIRRTGGRPFFTLTPPYVPGTAVGGLVRSVGPGVDPSWVGRTVVARTGGTGGYAERVAMDLAAVTPVPDGLDVGVATGLAQDGVTALALADLTRTGPGDAVLVVGASGALGNVSVRLSLARGARVVAVARDAAKLARVRQLGPDAVVDSDGPDWVSAARDALGGKGADVVLDNVGGPLGDQAFALVAPGGRFSAHGTPSGRFAAVDGADRGVEVLGIADVQLDDGERSRLTARVLAAAVRDDLGPVIGQTFPLDRAADAHAAIEARTVFGKTLLVP